MKQLLIILIFKLILITSINAQWRNHFNNNFTGTLSQLTITDSQTGYLLGDFGLLYKTTDAGQTWNKLTLITNNTISGNCFVNSNMGFLCNDKGFIGKTTDGGKTWIFPHRSLSINESFSSIKFLDGDTGFIGTKNSNNNLFYTTDGGKTLSIMLSGIMTYVLDICCKDKNNIFIVGGSSSNNNMYHSDNAGKTWSLVSPTYSIHEFKKIFFLNSDTGFAVGYDMIKTIDGGKTWALCNPAVVNAFLDLTFLNGKIGFCAGGRGEIYYTLDFGINWIKCNTPISINSLIKIAFFDSQNGICLGKNNYILKTSDGGINWSILNKDEPKDIKEVKFVDEKNGLLCGSNGLLMKTIDGGNSWISISKNNWANYTSIFYRKKDTIYLSRNDSNLIMKSTDAGNTWKKFTNVFVDKFWFLNDSIIITISDNGIYRSENFGKTFSLMTFINARSIFFLDEDTGYVVGNGSKILKTKDKGLTWKDISFDSWFEYKSVLFTSPSTGYIGYYNGLYKTTNYGNSWSYIYTPLVGPLNFVDADTGYYGNMAKTIDGGNKWFLLNTQKYLTLNSIATLSGTKVFAAGNKNTLISSTVGDVRYPIVKMPVRVNSISSSPNGFLVTTTDGKLYKSIDDGISWSLNYLSTTSSLNSSFVSSNMDYYIIGNSGYISKSNNNGLNWTKQTSNTTSNLFSICFIDSLNGYVVGASGTMLKTSNKGKTWNLSNLVTTNNLRDVYFVNNNFGAIVGDNGEILTSSNSGKNWQKSNSTTTFSLYSIFFLDTLNGFCVGENGIVLKTADGGLSWINSFLNTSSSLKDIIFIDSITGYITGEFGVVFKTKDGGKTWRYLPTGTLESMEGIALNQNGIIMMVGMSWIAFRFNENFDPVTFLDNHKIIDMTLYPNPANDFIVINLNGVCEKIFLVSIWNLQGKNVKTVSWENQYKNELKIDVREIPDGLYLVQIKSETDSWTHKVFILH